MLKTPIKATYQDYLKLPEDSRYELIEGKLLMTPSPFLRHQSVIAKLYKYLSQYVDANNLGKIYFAPLDVILSNETVVQPDILFVSHQRSSILRDWVHGAPDMIVEIISQGSKERDRLIKKSLYEKHGVQEYWMVDLEREFVEALVLKESSYELLGIFMKEDTLSSPIFQDLKLSVASIFVD